MAYSKHFEYKVGAVLNTFRTSLGTGCAAERDLLVDALDEEFCESRNAALLMAGCIDAPEIIPSGAIVRTNYCPSYNVFTEPGRTSREP